VPVDVNAGSIISYSAVQFPQQILYTLPTAINNFEVRLKSYNNVQLDLNGSEWTMLLAIEYE